MNRLRLTLISCLSAVAVSMVWTLPASAEKKKNVLDVKESISDQNIIYPEANFEAESRKMLEEWYMKNYMATDDRYLTKEDVFTSDETYRRRLAELPTIIEMPFNSIVKSHIERYTKKGRPMVASLLGLSNYYMPIFEQALEEQGLPLELKYLPVIESALDPNAVSRSGATGLWQFMLNSAKGLNMEVNSLVDERRDPYISSAKAAKFLKDLYKTYGDWSLAIAAYNCGPGTVNKALRRAGDDPSNLDFWKIYNYLPEQTRGYVPAFIAANYVMNYHKDHNISPVIPKRPLVTDTLHINNRVHFNQISKVLDIPLEELRMLNPQFRADLIPGTSSKSYTLILPSQQIHAYILSEEDITSFEAEKYARRTTAEPGKAIGEVEVTDTYMASNEPELSTLYKEMADAPTQGLQQSANTEPAPSPRVKETNSPSRTLGPTQKKVKGEVQTHKVEPGESLYSIAAKFGVAPEQIKEWNNLSRNTIRVGQVLRVAGDGKTTKQETKAAPSQSAQPTQSKTPVQPKAAPQAKSTTSKAAGKETKKKKEEPKKKGKSVRTKAEPAKQKEHTVQSGESYERIAKKSGISADELMKANGAKSDRLQPDQKLKIPNKASSKASSKASQSSATKSGKSSSKASTSKKSKKKK